MQHGGARCTRRVRVVIGRQFAQLDLDQRERLGGGTSVDRRHRRDRLAAIAHPVAGEGEFVLGDRQHAERDFAIGAGDHRAHPGKREGGGRIDRNQLGMADGAAQDTPRQRVAERQIGGIGGLAGDLVGAVDQRRALTNRGHTVSAAARRTASIIFTYPVQRQMLLAKAARISSSLGSALRRNSPSEAMIMPGVQ